MKSACWPSWSCTLGAEYTPCPEDKERWREQLSTHRCEMLLEPTVGWVGREKPSEKGVSSREHRPGVLERQKCSQWGTDESQASEVTERRRHSLGSRGAEQPKKPLSMAGTWRRTPPRRQTTGNLFASLLLISNSINRANWLLPGKTLLWLLTSVFQ